MIGNSAAINQLRQAIDKVAPTNSRVLITGPSGSGKELAARVMHAKSPRADGPFVVLNAAAMVPDRVEDELFGTEEGAGSGPRKVGALEEAHGGTLYIDEVADMPLETQGKILRVLVEQSFQRLGRRTRRCRSTCASSPRPAATCRRRCRRAASARISYHRLNVVPLRVPGLAERREDIPELVHYFVQAISVASGLAAAAHRRGRHGRAAGARLAGQRARAAQQHRAADDPRRRRPRRRSSPPTCCPRRSARPCRCRRNGAGASI